MILGVLREHGGDEQRVAIVPETVKRLAQKGASILVEQGAGAGAFFSDADYAAAGARLVPSAEEVWRAADTIAHLGAPPDAEIAAIKDGTTVVGLLSALSDAALVRKLAERKTTSLALELVPRTTIAQSMDVLSSQANIAGYWAVVAAAGRLPKYLPMLMTAAGTITPARAFVMGAGVAGLAAIGTAKRLGAVVEATDVRPETKEQVESVGGKFLEVTGVTVAKGEGGYAAEQSPEYKAKQAELVAAAIARADIVVTTALVPGRRAPILVTRAHLASMRAGSVVVDLAARQGGNVEGCEPGRETRTENGVLILAPTNAPSALSTHASVTFSRNVEKLLVHFMKDGALVFPDDEEISRGSIVTKGGDIVHGAVRKAMGIASESVGAS